MDPSLPIGPYDPNIPHQRWPLPARPTPSPLESRAHEIAVRTIHTPKPEGSLTVADRITYDKELCLLLDDVHTLCLDILSGKEEETESLHVDLSVIKRKVDKIHQELDKERLANVDDPFVGDEIAERIGIVESDLQDVQQILNFSSRYQELERRIEDWNFLAENTYNPDGEYLQENAYDSLARYVDMQTKLTELENVPRSPEQDQLLQEITQDLKQIRQTFTKVVLPTLKEKLQEAQKNYQQAAKALEKSGLFNRWIRDSHDAILTDFSNFQFALADLRYQKAALEAACSKLPASNKAISKALEHFLAADFIAKKSIETAEKAFIRRIEALPDEKKGLFLKSLPHHSDRAGFAFFLRIYEVISKETSAKDPYFKELASIAQKRSGGNSPNMTTQQMYQTTLEVDYHNKAVISNMNWRQQEDALIKELEKETSVWKKLGLGAFFLLLHAGVAAHGVKKMQGEAAALPSRADRLQQELLSLAGNRAARGAAFIGTMLSDKYEALRTMSEADLQRMTKRFSDDVRQTLEPFRMGAPKPSPDEIFTLHQRYVLQHAKPTLQEQISNWYTQFTTGQAEETVFPESSEAQIAPLQDSLALSSNINLQALLLKAIDNQDLRSVEKLFKTGVDFSSVKLPDSIENKAREILMGLFSRWHSHQNQNERIESEALIIGLLKAIQDPNGKCEGGVPFLHKAVSQRMLGPVKLLLEQGADINSKDEDGNTPLEFAFSVEEPNEEIVMELLKATNEPNGELKDGTPFLLQAVIQDLLGPVKLLLGQGADFNAENDFGQTAIELAFIRGKPNENLIIELIKAGINPNSEIYEKPLLQLAIENNLPEASAALIEHGADINRLDAMGKPPLLYADEQVTIEALLKAGASLTLPNGRSVVDVAIQEKNWDLIITILAIRAPKLTQNAVKSLSKEAPDFILKKLTSHLNWSDYRKIFNPSSFMQLGKLTLLLEALNQGMDINYPDQTE